MPRVEKAYRIL